ncbi:MAG: acylphosphatase, partial [Candidatus Kapaibacterium sp.]
HLIVTGLVQGVGFRYYTHKEAVALKLTGFVRNIHNDSVEIEAQGTEDHIERLIEWVKKGPRNAIVDSVRQIEMKVLGDEIDFEIR